jgi:ERCC4-related helicase
VYRTRVEEHLAKFCNKATHIYDELGSWAADYFIIQSIAALEASNSLESDMFARQENRDRVSLLRILKQGQLVKLLEIRSHEGPYLISSKVKDLITFLNDQDCNECSGLMFVRQRATVSVLCTLLSTHPNTKGRFRCATFVGMSSNVAKKATMAELLDIKAQRETLAEFRARRKNLIIATDALEEGIDVTACNLVICFDPPPNLKSFIQRRGRARQEKSKFAIMFPKNEGSSKIDSWRALEANLIRAYQDELRQVQDLASTEHELEVVPGKLEAKSG